MVELGDVALRVRDLERSVDFYTKVVRLKLTGRVAGGRAALLTGGRQHHELLLVAAPSMDGASPHVSLCITSHGRSATDWMPCVPQRTDSTASATQ